MDELTGLHSRKQLEPLLALEIERAKHYGGWLGLMLLDIDNLKSLNSDFGYKAGDSVIKVFADEAKREARAFDLVARFGGDEFIIVMPHVTEQSARTMAENLRASIEGLSIPISDLNGSNRIIKVTFSAGVAMYPADAKTPEDLIRSAANTLELAKQSRNTILFAT